MKLFVLLFAIIGMCFGAQFNIINYHDGPILVGIQGGDGHYALAGGGFRLDIGQNRVVYAPGNWEGRFWARTWCYGNHCKTGNCGNRLHCNGAGQPPATLVEINLNRYGQDYYRISLADGFNSMASIRPIGGRGHCPHLQCKRDLNRYCPNDLRVVHSGQTIGCRTGYYNTWTGWGGDYFKSNCPQAYSYSYDDRSSLYMCSADRYEIEFG